MTGPAPSAAPERSTPPPSDPTRKETAAEWGDRLLPERPLRFVANGRIAGCSWARLTERTLAAFKECGLDLAETRPPPYTRKDLSYIGARPGYGWIVGEADLRAITTGVAGMTAFESFVAAVQAWTRPALERGDLDSVLTPHDWAARVRAGRVHSVEVISRYSGPIRQYRGTADTEERYGWIPSAILSRLSETDPE